MRLSRDAHFSSTEHYLSSASARAEAACAYDLDGCDATWLRALNGERARAGSQTIKEDQFERVIEELEVNPNFICPKTCYFWVLHKIEILNDNPGEIY